MHFGPGGIGAGSFPRSALSRVGWASARSVCVHVAGPATLGGRVRAQRHEKTSIQVRRRRHPTLPERPSQTTRVEHEYQRSGALQYLAAWDVHRAAVFGRCEPHTGKVAFGHLVDQVMDQEPYRSARRVFWIVDNGSSHRGQRAAEELQDRHPRIVIVHTPVHASWLNQIEIYFSIISARSLPRMTASPWTSSPPEIHAFGQRYSALDKPFAWHFTRQDLEQRLRDPRLQLEAPCRLAPPGSAPRQG